MLNVEFYSLLFCPSWPWPWAQGARRLFRRTTAPCFPSANTCPDQRSLGSADCGCCCCCYWRLWYLSCSNIKPMSGSDAYIWCVGISVTVHWMVFHLNVLHWQSESFSIRTPRRKRRRKMPTRQSDAYIWCLWILNISDRNMNSQHVLTSASTPKVQTICFLKWQNWYVLATNSKTLHQLNQVFPVYRCIHMKLVEGKPSTIWIGKYPILKSPKVQKSWFACFWWNLHTFWCYLRVVSCTIFF